MAGFEDADATQHHLFDPLRVLGRNFLSLHDARPISELIKSRSRTPSEWQVSKTRMPHNTTDLTHSECLVGTFRTHRTLAGESELIKSRSRTPSEWQVSKTRMPHNTTYLTHSESLVGTFCPYTTLVRYQN